MEGNTREGDEELFHIKYHDNGTTVVISLLTELPVNQRILGVALLRKAGRAASGFKVAYTGERQRRNQLLSEQALQLLRSYMIRFRYEQRLSVIVFIRGQDVELDHFNQLFDEAKRRAKVLSDAWKEDEGGRVMVLKRLPREYRRWEERARDARAAVESYLARTKLEQQRTDHIVSSSLLFHPVN